MRARRASSFSDAGGRGCASGVLAVRSAESGDAASERADERGGGDDFDGDQSGAHRVRRRVVGGFGVADSADVLRAVFGGVVGSAGECVCAGVRAAPLCRAATSPPARGGRNFCPCGTSPLARGGRKFLSLRDISPAKRGENILVLDWRGAVDPVLNVGFSSLQRVHGVAADVAEVSVEREQVFNALVIHRVHQHAVDQAGRSARLAPVPLDPALQRCRCL